MEYVCPINISKYKEIQDKFKDKELIATNKRNITLSREEQDWLSTQIYQMWIVLIILNIVFQKQ